jgi:hypothetical protein
MKNHRHKVIIPIIVIIIAILALVLLLGGKPTVQKPVVTNFDECVAAGNPVMESFPRQCAVDGVTYTEVVVNPSENPDGAVNADVSNMIRITSPSVNGSIKSPLTIKGEARGGWYHEATFPVTLTNWDGLIIAEGYAQAEGEWMTSEFVPFAATLTFKKPEFNNRGFLILKKANASGLPENDAALEIQVFFEGVAPQGQGNGGNISPAPDDQQIFCTADAMQCPDGSYVGRQGPKCEFAPCPGN